MLTVVDLIANKLVHGSSSNHNESILSAVIIIIIL